MLKRYIGVAFMLIAVVLFILPRYTDCQSQGRSLQLANGSTAPMKCHWSGIGEEALAIPLFAVGALMAGKRSDDGYLSLTIMAAVLGLVIILIPTYLIGVCPTLTMICHTVMLPATVTLGALVVAGSIAALLMRGRTTTP